MKKRDGQKRGGFLDGFFNTFRRKSTSPTSTAGVSGYEIFGGYINDNESSADLTGVRKYTTYTNMMSNISIIGAGVRYYLGLIGKAGWKVEPADESSEAEELADKISEILFNVLATPWHRVVRRASMFRFWGFSIQEWTAKRLDDGTIGLLDVAPRPQRTIERWDTDPVGTVFGVVQRAPQNAQELYIPRSKVVYIVDDAINDSPEGLGMFRNLAEPARRVQRYEQLEGWGFESDLRGIPIGRAPFQELRRQEAAGEITADQRKTQEQGLTDFLKNHIKNPSLAIALEGDA